MSIIEEDILADDFVCIDRERGEKLIDGYFAKTLSAEEEQAFDMHRHLCLKCREDVEYMQWVLQALKSNTPFSEPSPEEIPLKVTSVCDPQQNVTAFFHDPSLYHELAAEGAGQIHVQQFPLTLEFADGLVIGEFRNALGVLCFQPQTIAIDPERYACVLAYAPTSGEGRKTWELSEREEIWLGNLHDFAPSLSPTPQQVFAALRHFHIVLNPRG